MFIATQLNSNRRPVELRRYRHFADATRRRVELCRYRRVSIATQLNSTQLTQFVGREVINKNTTDYLYAVQLGQLS